MIVLASWFVQLLAQLVQKHHLALATPTSAQRQSPHPSTPQRTEEAKEIERDAMRRGTRALCALLALSLLCLALHFQGASCLAGGGGGARGGSGGGGGGRAARGGGAEEGGGAGSGSVVGAGARTTDAAGGASNVNGGRSTAVARGASGRGAWRVAGAGAALVAAAAVSGG